MKPTMDRCPIDGAGPTVGSSGPSPCRAMIIGEHPAFNEVRTGIPFSGESGMLLNRMLGWCGLKREEIYVTNARKCPGNKKEICDECKDDLANEIEQVNPEVILAAGGIARNVLDGKGVLGSRGFVYPFQGGDRKLIGTFNPAAILRKPNTFDLFAFDVDRFAKVLNGEFVQQDIQVIHIKPHQFEDFFSVLKQADLVAYDLETDYLALGADILSISFAVSADRGFVIEWCDEVISYVKDLLEGPTPIAGQNLFFDNSHMQNLGIRVRNVKFDTMLAHHLIKSYLPHDLNTLLSIYTTLEKYDDEQKALIKNRDMLFSTIPKSILLPYSAKDAAATFALIAPLTEELKKEGVWDFFNRIVMPLCSVLVNMRIRGIKMDVDKFDEVRNVLDEELQDLDGQLVEILGEINFNSGAQLGKALQELGLDTGKKTKKTKKMSTAKEDLEGIEEKHPVIRILLTRKEKAKLRSTYTSDTMLSFCDENDRVHPGWKQTGTVSIRLACEKPNMLNPPRGSLIRQLFVAEEDYIWAAGDLAQAELRVAAFSAQDPILIKTFEDGLDVHTTMASEMTGVPYAEIDHDSDIRHRAKFITHGRSYGREYQSVMSQYNVDEKTARGWIDSFDSKFERLMSWYTEKVAQAKKDKFLQTPYGNKRHWPLYGEFDENMEREARSFIPQSTVAIIIYEAMIALEDLFEREGFGTRIISNLYDAIYFEIPRDELHTVLPIIKREMTVMVPVINIEIPVDFKLSDRWEGEPIEVEGIT